MLIKFLDFLAHKFDTSPYWKKEKYICFSKQLPFLGIELSTLKEYQVFMESFRNKNELEPQRALAFYQTSMEELYKNIFSSLLSFPALGSYTQDLLHVYQQIEALPKDLTSCFWIIEYYRWRAALSWKFDSNYLGNIPHKIKDLAKVGGKPVQNLRLGSPTYERNLLCSADLVPEFTAFLEAYKAENKQHLYINLQKRSPYIFRRIFPIHNESRRCKALEKASQDYGEVLFFISLPKDTQFYHQKGKFSVSKYENVAYFREVFLQILCDGDQSSYYSPQIFQYTSLSLKELFDKVFTFVWTCCFDQAPKLEDQERREFIEISYLFFIDYFIEHLPIHSFNISCRDSIDRGITSNALLLHWNNLMENKHYSQDFSRFLTAQTLFPALVVRYRSMRSKRFDLLIRCMERIEKHKEIILSKKSRIKGI